MTQIYNDNNFLHNLLNIYDRVMILKVYVDGDNELYNKYYEAIYNHNTKILNNPNIIDAGFDLITPGNEGNRLIEFDDLLPFYGPGPNINPVNKVDFKICCSARMQTSSNKSFNTGFYMYPRSSLSKTQLRLANSTGIVDAGYRGHLIGMFDVVNIDTTIDTNHKKIPDYLGKKFDRYIQICAPGLVPIIVEMVSTMEELGVETERGSGGFGSTGR